MCVGRPRQRTPELRVRFIAETLGLLESCGPDRVTTRAVAAASDSSQAALHELFGGKPGLIDAAALAGFTALRDALCQPSPIDQSATSLLALCQAHRAFGARHPQLSALMYSRPHGDFAPSKSDRVVALEIVELFTVEIALLLGAEHGSEEVTDVSLGLIALLVGLHSQERSGTLGSTVEVIGRRWTMAINRYLG